MTSTGRQWNELTLWPEDTPASHSVRPAGEPAKTIPATSGPFSPSAFAWFDRATHSWRTLQATLVSDSDLYSQTWPRSGMTHDGTAYQLPPSAPRTSAIEFSLSQGTQGPNSDGLWPTATTQDHATRYAQGGMPLGMAVRLWRTPQASDGKNRGNPEDPAIQRRLANGNQISLSMMVSGHLNPMWVEWLMGFPEGWTDLEASGTPSSHK